MKILSAILLNFVFLSIISCTSPEKETQSELLLENIEEPSFSDVCLDDCPKEKSVKLNNGARDSEWDDSVFQIKGRVVSETEPINGILKDDLWIIGVGDPLLMTSKYAERYKDPFLYTDIKDLALGIVASGINQIEGSVIGDEILFDDMRFVESWPERFRYTEQKQSGPISALSLNAGFVRWDPVQESNGFNTPAEEPVLVDVEAHRGRCGRAPRPGSGSRVCDGNEWNQRNE